MEVTLGFNDAEFMDVVQAAANEAVQRAAKDAISTIRSRVSDLVDQAIRNSPEWESLVAGQLREEFGIADARPILENILQAVRDSISVRFEATGQGSFGQMFVGVLQSDFSDVLAVPGTSYVSQGKLGIPYVIDWLQWLLFRGSDIVLLDAEINTNRASRKASRTGRAIMVHPQKRPSLGWGVPMEFSGTESNNWLSRAMDSIGDAIYDIAFEEIRSRVE